MQDQKYQINVAPGAEKVEVIVRELNSLNELDVRPPVKIDLKGVICAPYEFLQKRMPVVDDVSNQIDLSRCHIIINREKLSILLVINENDEYLKGSIEGILSTHPKMNEFGINTGKNWEPNELGQFLKMNRAFFVDKNENMALVNQLKNFEAKINSNIEKQKNESGSFADNYSAVVTSNLPGSFKLQIPIFKGRPSETLEVEFYASINGRTVNLQLYSPGACQALEDLRDKVIDEQIELFQKLAPSIPIIEQ